MPGQGGVGRWGVPTLVVSAHPDAASLTHVIAERLVAELPGPVESADLAAEGFDPRFTLDDRSTYATGVATPEIAGEQARLDRASDVVLVFPVYWWSMPALLKGWIDRVFVNGWAFDVDPEGGIRRRLDRLRIHLVPIAGDDAGVYDRHGYGAAFEAQIMHGIVDFCGARRGVTAFVHESEQTDAAARARSIDAAVDAVRRAIED